MGRRKEIHQFVAAYLSLELCSSCEGDKNLRKKNTDRQDSTWPIPDSASRIAGIERKEKGVESSHLLEEEQLKRGRFFRGGKANLAARRLVTSSKAVDFNNPEVVRYVA